MKFRFLALLLLVTALPAAAGRLIDKGVADGLGNRKVYQVCQDADGYIWFYTQSSIDRYDGFEFKHYLLGPEATEGNYTATASTLVLDTRGVLHVVQTNGRVYRYCKEKDVLEEAFVSEHGGYLLAVLFEEGKTWLGTSEGLFTLEGNKFFGPGPGVNCLHRAGGILYLGTEEGLYCLEGNLIRPVAAVPPVQVTALESQTDGRLYVGSFADGSYCYNPQTDRCTSLPLSLPGMPVRKIVRSGTHLLFGIDGAGIAEYDPERGTVIRLLRYDDRGDGLCADTVSDLLVDRSGILWVSTTTGGICFEDPLRLGLEWFRHIPGEKNSLLSNHVNAVLEDRRGRLWFATNQGLCRLDGQNWKSFDVPGGADVVLSLAEDRQGRIWAGGYGHPVFSVDGRDHVRPLDPDRFRYTFSLTVQGDSLWIGDLNDPLTCVDLKGGNEMAFPEKEIWDLYPGEKVWVASHTGLGYASLTDRAVHWLDLPEGASGAWCITRDARGNLWAGLEKGGLLRYCPADGSMTRYPLDETVFSILPSADGKIWAVSGREIFRLNPEDREPVVMNRFLGIEKGEFNHTSATGLSDGRLLFGTADGALAFDPARIPDSPMPAVAPVFTGFRLLSGDTQRILKGGSAQGLRHISLRSEERSFQLSFSALELQNPARLRFDYQLEGYDPGPRSSFSATTVEYTAVPPGRYTFAVKVVDMFTENVLGERSLGITVRRPPLLSLVAMALYLLLAVLAIVLLDRQRRHHLRRQMTQERLDTFIRFAHELKTPVSLIRAPLSVLDKDSGLPERERESVSTAIRNTDRLMNMINSLLDLREDGNADSRLQLEPCDLGDYLGEMLDTFRPIARQKGIDLSSEVSEGMSPVLLDREKMDRIVQNLVSNAVKYTESGWVKVWAQPAGRQWKLCVQDTGIGIPAAMRSRIFNGGVRAANARDVDETGYGIGLMITRQLVALHRGSISLESEEGAGSRFTLFFPLEYKESEATLLQADVPENAPEVLPQDKTRPRILIVEDDAEMLRFLKEYLGADFETLAAPDGDAALKMAEEMQPDLVLSDVVMPGVNGYELCRQLKSSLATSHIPVILLTAMDDKEHILLGLESGSDDYILKPFDPQVLSARISNLLHERERLRTLILRSGREQKQREYTNRLDQEFMERVLSVIESSYSDPEFQIEDLCRSMAMSRTAFFNKLKALLGTGPNDFIRIYRLDKARELLESGQYTIAEVSAMVGFSDAKYFSSCFKRAFGVSPSKY